MSANNDTPFESSGGFDPAAFAARIAPHATKTPEPVPKADPAPQEAAEGEKTEKVGEQMKFWPEDVCAMPTELTRVSLFRLVRRGRRKIMDAVKLESRSDVEVLFSGKELDQADADLWLACLRLARGVPMGQRIHTTRAALLKEIGRCTGTGDYNWLKEALRRLKQASFEVTYKREGKTFIVSTGMLNWGLIEETGQMFIRLDPDGYKLFDNLSYIDWEERLSLKLDATKALQIYASGHQAGKPHSVALADLAAWSGYGGRLRQFRRDCIEPALVELEAAGFLRDGKVTKNGRVMVSWFRIKKEIDR